jgi:DNA repair photolyase
MGARSLPTLDTQSDIVYLDAVARSVLNPPASTGIGCWSINPYVGCAFGCAYCYARFAHRYAMERAGAAGDAGLPAWLAFERRVLVKRDAPALVRRALGSGSARYLPLRAGAESLVIGTATDPYQPAERRFRVTRGVLEALAEHAGLRVVIITKSALVSRDVDVLARLSARSRLSIHMSLITLDRALARRVEPRAPTPDARLHAIERLAAHGIDVGVNVMPVLPGITDARPALAALVARAAGAGARHVAAAALRLCPTARARYLPWIAEEFPALAARYRTTYAHDHYVGERYRAGLQAFVERLAARHGLRTREYRRDGTGYDPDDAPTRAAAEAAQLALGIG